MEANHDWCSRNDSQKQRVFVDFIAEAGTFREWIAGATVPAYLQVSCVGNTQQKAGGELSNGDEMGVLNGKGAKRALCMILFCSSNRFICRGSSLRIRCAHLLAHIWLHAIAWPCAYNHGTLGRAPKKHPVKIVWTVWGGLCWYNSFKGKLWSWCPKTIENSEQKQVGGFRTSHISSFS